MSGLYFLNKESPAERKEQFIKDIKMSYILNLSLTQYSANRIQDISGEWLRTDRDGAIAVAIKAESMKIDTVADYMAKVESRKDIDLELHLAMEELYSSSLGIWEFAKRPTTIGVRKNYNAKADELLSIYRSKKSIVEKLYDSRQFKGDGGKVVDLKQAGVLVEGMIEEQLKSIRNKYEN